MALAVSEFAIVFTVGKHSLICVVFIGRKLSREQVAWKSRLHLEFEHVVLKVWILKQFCSLKYRKRDALISSEFRVRCSL
jgi:hypothetical protein